MNLTLSAKWKNRLWQIFAVVMVVIGAVLFLTDDLEHIEDTNGADNYKLQEITDENIINCDIGAINLRKTEGIITDTTTYSSEKYTGVSEIYGENIITNRYVIHMNHARVDAGNFRIVLVVDDEIVHDFTLNELTQTYVLEDVSGYVALRIAGESADFQFDYWVE